MQLNAYLQLIQKMDALYALNKEYDLNSTEKRLLEAVMISDQSEQIILVGDLINRKQLGSIATLHVRLQKLKKQGYIELVHQADGRKKGLDQPIKHTDYLIYCLNA